MRLIRIIRLCIITLSWFITVSWIVAIGTFILLFPINDAQYDKFYPYRLTLESPKTNYPVGNEIKLIAKVVSDHPATIRVYKDRTKSFALYIDAIDIQPNFTRDLAYPLPGATAKDAIEVISIAPGKPFQLELQGQAIQTKSKEILLNFGEFGSFKKSNPGNFKVSGYWRPISPDPIDSLEDSTNLIVLNIALPE